MRDFIERLKAKPEHVRRRIAIGTSAGITGVVATGWFFTLLFAGNLSLAIKPTIIGDNGQVAQVDNNGNIINQNGNASNVAGVDAASIFQSAPQAHHTTLSKLLAAVGVSTDPAPAPALTVEDKAPTTTAPVQPTSISF